jgi:hypothetical protein
MPANASGRLSSLRQLSSGSGYISEVLQNDARIRSLRLDFCPLLEHLLYEGTDINDNPITVLTNSCGKRITALAVFVVVIRLERRDVPDRAQHFCPESMMDVRSSHPPELRCLIPSAAVACEQNWFIALVSVQSLFEESLLVLMMSAIHADGITAWEEWLTD